MNTHWFITLIALCCPAMILAAPKETAVVAPVDAISFLKQHDAEVQAILAEATADTIPPALRENIKGHINAAFDFPELSRLALGTHWQERTPEDRDHFIQTFSGIIEEQNFDSFVQYYREGKITYESAERDGDATGARQAGHTHAPPTRRGRARSASPPRLVRRLTARRIRRERISQRLRMQRKRARPAMVEGRAGQALAQAVRAGARHARRMRGLRHAAGRQQRGEKQALPGRRPMCARLRGWRRFGGCGHPRG